MEVFLRNLFFLIALLVARVCLAGNILCVYTFEENAWQSQAWYEYLDFGDTRQFGSISVGAQDEGGGHALCSRFIDDADNGNGIFEQAHYIVQGEGFGPDAATCEVSSRQSPQLIERHKINLSAGSSTLISSPKFQFLHYLPTRAELDLWESAPKNSFGDLIEQKCTMLLPGSIHTNVKAFSKIHMNIKK
jgi:hypothetical protein